MRPLLIGEAPGKVGDPRRPLDGRVGARLAALAGLSVVEFRRRCARANVLPAWPGSAGKGAAFPVAVARLYAHRLRRRFVGGRTVVLLGKRTATAFGVSQPYFDRARIGGGGKVNVVIIVVPHPSGINRWYNDPANVATIRACLADVFGGRA